MTSRRLRVLTWHVHGNYLWYLSETPCEFVLPVGKRPEHGYGGRGDTFPFGDNVVDCPIEDLPNQRFDCILFQSRRHYEVDQYELLSPAQRRLPRIYLQHDPPWEDVTDQTHWFQDREGMLVHVTHFNRLMWQSSVPTRVVEHGVKVPESVRATCELDRGITALNHLVQRGRKVGADVFESLARHTPLDLIGMASQDAAGGLGEIRPPELPEFIARYRYFFSPIRYTSLGLAILEAMSVGLPIVGLATCELATVIENGRSGFLETDTARLLEHMQRLVRDRAEAQTLGQAARQLARERFGIQRFAADWSHLLWEVAGDSIPRSRTKSAATALDRSHEGATP